MSLNNKMKSQKHKSIRILQAIGEPENIEIEEPQSDF